MTMVLEVDRIRKFFNPMDTWFGKAGKPVRAVDEVTFSISKGESFALVGESGCGKSTVARCIAGLLNPDSGVMKVNRQDLVVMRKNDNRAACRAVQMVFQDPYSSLNPRMTVGDAVAEPLLIDGLLSRIAIRKKVSELLIEVGLDSDAALKFPHEFSGGQRQRIGIARALALEPSLLIADEPVSALDVSIQSQILLLLQSLQKSRNLSLLFITHDLAVVRNFCDRMAVMYLGRLVEQGKVEDLLGSPQHPYTIALRAAALLPDMSAKHALTRSDGEMPSPVNPPGGCHFHPRCSVRLEQCQNVDPVWIHNKMGHSIRCHLA